MEIVASTGEDIFKCLAEYFEFQFYKIFGVAKAPDERKH